MTISLVSLLWEDILFKHVLSTLSIKDLFILRGLSRDYKRLIDAYFEYMHELNLSKYHKSFNAAAFLVLSKRCRRLRRIVLSYCDWLTDELVEPLFANNPNISYLVLNNCKNLTSVCLQNVIISCKRLKCLKLENCFWLSVGCLEAITLHQDSLEEVDLSACTAIFTTHAINCFIRKFSKLRTVCLANNSCVTNSTLFAMARSCQRLEHVNLRSCPLITDHGLRVLVEYCKGLKSLLVLGCPRVSQRFLEELRGRIHLDKQRSHHLSLIPPPLPLFLQV